MKKHRFTALIAACMLAFTGAGGCAEPFVATVSAESAKLAAPSGFKALSVTYDSVTLKWSAVSGADAYRVFMYSSKTKKFEMYSDVTGRSCNVTGLSAGKTYKFKVAALVISGSSRKLQTASDKLSVKTLAKLAAPKNVTYSQDGKSSVRIAWSAVKGAEWYNIYVCEPDSDNFTLVQKRVKRTYYYIEDGFDWWKTYRYRVVAVAKAGNEYVEQTYSKDAKNKPYTSWSGKDQPGTYNQLEGYESVEKAIIKSGITNYTKKTQSNGDIVYTGEVCAGIDDYVCKYQLTVRNGKLLCDTLYFYDSENGFLELMEYYNKVLAPYEKRGQYYYFFRSERDHNTLIFSYDYDTGTIVETNMFK